MWRISNFLLMILKKEKGASAVEFALVLPILILLVVVIIQCGIIFNYYISITHAAREGVRWASLEKPVSFVKDKAQKAAPNLDWSDPSEWSITVTMGDPPVTLGDADQATIADQGEPIQVSVAYDAPILEQIFAGWVKSTAEGPKVTVTSSATQRIE